MTMDGPSGGSRYPVSCWYTVGMAEVIDVLDTRSFVIAWTIGSSVYVTVALPGQCFSFVDDGMLRHAAILPTSTTTNGYIQLNDSAVPLSTAIRRGVRLAYMVRARAPDYVLLGPIFASSERVVRFLVPRNSNAGFLLPRPNQSLVYLGGEGTNPLRPCRMHDAATAQQSIFACESIAKLAPGVTYPVSMAIFNGQNMQNWQQITDYCLIGVLSLPTNGNGTVSFTYTWPFPMDQDGVVWILGTNDTLPLPKDILVQTTIPTDVVPNTLILATNYANLNGTNLVLVYPGSSPRQLKTGQISYDAMGPLPRNIWIVFERLPHQLFSLQPHTASNNALCACCKVTRSFL